MVFGIALKTVLRLKPLMALAATTSSNALDEKYQIQRPTYKPEDLQELQQLISDAALEHPEWNQFWIEEPTLIRFLKGIFCVF